MVHNTQLETTLQPSEPKTYRCVFESKGYPFSTFPKGPTRKSRPSLIDGNDFTVANDWPYFVHDRVIRHIVTQKEWRRHYGPGSKVCPCFFVGQSDILNSIGSIFAAYFQHVQVRPASWSGQTLKIGEGKLQNCHEGSKRSPFNVFGRG